MLWSCVGAAQLASNAASKSLTRYYADYEDVGVMLNDTQALPPSPLPAQSAHDPAEHRLSIESTRKTLAPSGARLSRLGAAEAAQPLLSLFVPLLALSVHYPYP